MITEVFVIMVEARPNDWRRVGPVYRKRATAKSWVSFVRSAWHGSPTKIRRLPVKTVDGKPTPECVALFDRHGIDIT